MEVLLHVFCRPTSPLYGVQFHPEVYHSTEGKKVLHNFLVNICGCHEN